ncbi:hypothetical protein GN956_G13363 [Arapaima gigas]
MITAAEAQARGGVETLTRTSENIDQCDHKRTVMLFFSLLLAAFVRLSPTSSRAQFTHLCSGQGICKQLQGTGSTLHPSGGPRQRTRQLRLLPSLLFRTSPLRSAMRRPAGFRDEDNAPIPRRSLSCGNTGL